MGKPSKPTKLMSQVDRVPTLSIITVTFQAEKVLEETIHSVMDQSWYNQIEYLVIDGGSQDGTVDIIKQYEQHIHYWVSEADQGIYDAMNKGLQQAKGTYLLFLNAGDLLDHPHSVEHLLTSHPQADVYAGETMMIKEDGTPIGLRSEVTPHRLPTKLSWRSLRMGMVVCHQAFVVKRELAPLYSLQHPFSGDIDWEIKCLKKAQVTHTDPHIFVRYRMGGFSKKYLWKSWKDRFQILSKHYGYLPNIYHHLQISLRGILFVLKRRKLY